MDFVWLERPRRRGPRLAYALHVPEGKARAVVVLTHGYAEHMARYEHVIRAWNERGLLVVTHDLRGHGRSGGARGHVDRFDEYVDDVFELLSVIERDPRISPLGKPILFGHSLGGLISSHVVLREPSRFRSLAMTSPFYGLHKQPPRWQVVGGKVLNRILPRLRQPSGLSGYDLTHDQELAQKYESDPHHFGHVTVRFFNEVTAAQERLLNDARRITLPLFCLVAGEDRVVSNEAIRAVFSAVGSTDKELIVLDGSFHEILNELDRDRHVEALADRLSGWSG